MTSSRCAVPLIALVAALVAVPCVSAQNTGLGTPLQLVQPEGQSAPPPLITLQDALERARRLDAQFQSAIADAQIARQDRVQANARSCDAPR